VPLPWTADGSSFGFGPDSGEHADRGSTPWLPQPDWFGAYAADVQRDDPASVLELARAALARRHRHPALGDGDLTWRSAPGDEVLVFDRDPGFACVVNLSASAVPVDGEVLLASGPLDGDGALPPDTTAWLGG
jgi:alpha-glucosidase